ncbi:MAG: CidA/LrgA family protein [Clostridiales bacterium]|nr:CidA/LrgA family protein [Clostridiales bacterium]
MKFISQLFIILLFSFLGEILNRAIPAPVPGSVYGLALLFICLCIGLIKPQQIEGAAGFLISAMPIFFVAPTVSLMAEIGAIRDNMFAVIAISVISTFITAAVTGKTADIIINLKLKKKGGVS